MTERKAFDMEQSKTCSKCAQTKPSSEFGNHKGRSDGKQTSCLVCDRIRRAEYRAKYPEKVAKSQRQNYLKNREKRIANAAQIVKKNPERYKIYNAKSKRKNREAVAANTRRRNARRKNNGIFKIHKSELKTLLCKPCFYCGSIERQTIDHVVPIARGGTDSIGNLVTACKACNSQKRDMTIMEWRKYKANK